MIHDDIYYLTGLQNIDGIIGAPDQPSVSGFA
jgi:hypothetical protein